MALNADWNGATAAAEEAIERPLGPPAVKKLTSWNLFRSMGSPRFIVAPMVDQSELAWRILSRLHGSSVAYTPMIHAALFANPQNSRYRKEQFDLHAGEEGHETLDRPVVAQFCANDPDTFLQAATRLAESGQVDAVDLNLGCPQGIAKRGQYGAFLMEDWGLIERMISHLHKNLAVPITAKFRVYDDLDKTLAYAKMLEGAGAQILTLHGRTRDQKGQLTGLADWNKIRKVREAVSVPLFANGNILTHEDISRCLEETKADGIMSAEGNLYNPALFEPLNRSQAQTFRSQLPAELLAALDIIDNRFKVDRATVAYYPIVQLSLEYLTIVAGLETETALSAVKAHLFRMWKPVFNAGHHIDVRDALSRISSLSDGTEEFKEVIAKYVELTEKLGRKLEADFASGQLTTDPKVALPETQDSRSIPYSHCQPCMRPLSETEAASVNLKKRGLDSVQHEGVALGDGNETVKKAKTELPPGVQLLPQTVQCPQCKGSAAAQKCVRRVCRVCCTLATQNDADAEPCEAHLGKERKEAAKAEARKQAKEAKKARAQKQKADALAKKEAKRQKGRQGLVAGSLNDGDKVEAASAEEVASPA